MNATEQPEQIEGIAIVGMAGRFPGARNLEEFWRNLKNGVESISFFTDDELLAEGMDPALVGNANYIKARGVLGDIEYFDAPFFGHSPRFAELMDPQHRAFLECAWSALENAGYDAGRYKGRIGVYGGQSMNTYMITNLLDQLDLVASVDGLQAAIGNDKDSLTTEVAYKLNLKGPDHDPVFLLHLPGRRPCGLPELARLRVRYGLGRRGIDPLPGKGGLHVQRRGDHFPGRALPGI